MVLNAENVFTLFTLCCGVFICNKWPLFSFLYMAEVIVIFKLVLVTASGKICQFIPLISTPAFSAGIVPIPILI